MTAVWPAMVSGARNQTLAPSAITAICEIHPELTVSGTADAHGAMTGDNLLMRGNAIGAEVTDKYQLILAPDLDSYYMIDAVAVKIPALWSRPMR